MMKPRTRTLLTIAAALWLSSACSTVSQVHIRPDYEQVDRSQTFRLEVLISPLPEGSEALGRMWSLMAGRYVNHHRDFIAGAARASADLPEDLCGGGIEGVLHLRPEVRPDGDGYALGVHGRLFRCRDRETIWSATGAGSWPSDDPQLVEMTRAYGAELGEQIQAHVAPTFRLLRALLDTLPRPVLTRDEDVMDKIELSL